MGKDYPQKWLRPLSFRTPHKDFHFYPGLKFNNYADLNSPAESRMGKVLLTDGRLPGESDSRTFTWFVVNPCADSGGDLMTRSPKPFSWAAAAALVSVLF